MIGEAAAALTTAGFDDPRRRARNLVAAALGVSGAEVFAHPERALTAAQAARVDTVLLRAVAHEPLSRVVGVREFWGLDFLLSADTLDPRPESETVVEAVLARLPDRAAPYRLLDLGTGTGCLLLALLSELPQATGIGIDIAPGATDTARHNAERLGLGDRVRFVVSDWARAITGGFAAVVANPPYIATSAIAGLPAEVRVYDPHRALDGGADGLVAYRAIAAELPRLLSPCGLFAGELDEGQAAAVEAILAQHDVAVEAFAADLAGVARCVVARPRDAKKGWNAPRPPLG